jgi:peptide/nickel transport system substrate-binding protein
MKQNKKIKHWLIVITLIIAVLLSGCATATTSAPVVEETAEPQEQIEEPTSPPDVSVPVSTATTPPEPSEIIPTGGTAIIALIQEPGQLSRFFNVQSGSYISNLAVEQLFVPNGNGEYQPILAAEVPTLENGGISPDFLTITYKIRDGIKWSDGEPFTAEDIKFTFDVYQNPESTTQAGTPYSYVESVEVIDPLTVKVQMNSINTNFLELWQAVLPMHKFDSTIVTQEHELARIPLGTGPFIIQEWKTGDQIVFVRNPNYREPGKPILDEIVVKIVPEKETAIAGFLNGEFDYVYFLSAGDIATVQNGIDGGSPVHLEILPGGTQAEFLWFNMSNYGDLSKPHPVLGDPAIRAAFDYGIDRQAIIDNILGGFGSLTGSFIYSGWASTNRPAPAYDPEQAMQVLDEAGWVVGSDGIREKDGVRASLKFQTIAGDQTRELYQQLIQQNMKDIGIELVIENVPSNTLFGSYAEGGLLAVGNYDIVMSRDGYLIDPDPWVRCFTTDGIPSESNPDGFTYAYWSNQEFDNLANEAVQTLDTATRIDRYTQLDQLFVDTRPALSLYQQPFFNAWNNRLQGVSIDYFNPRLVFFSAADWMIGE